MSGGYEENGNKPWSLMHCTEPNCLQVMCKRHRPIQKRKQQPKSLAWYQQGFKVRIQEDQSGENPEQIENENNGTIVQQGGFSGGVSIVPILQENLQEDQPNGDVQLESIVEDNPERFDLMDGAEDDEIERACEASDVESEDSLDDKLVIELSTLKPEEDQKMDEETAKATDDADNIDDEPPSSPFSNCTTISSLSFSTDDEISQALEIKLDTDMNQDGGKTEEKNDVGEDNAYNNGVEDVKLVLDPERYEFQDNPNGNETEPMDVDENPVIVEVINVCPAVRKSQRLLSKLKISEEEEVNPKAKRSRWVTRHCKDCDSAAR